MDDALARLPQDLLYARDHRLQVRAMALDGHLVQQAHTALDARCHLAREALGLPDHAPCDGHQPAVALVQPILALLGAAAAGAADLHQATAGAPRTIAQLGARRTGQFGDSLHRPRQHPHAVTEQRAVGRVVDIGLTTVVSTRIRRPWTIFFSCAMATTR